MPAATTESVTRREGALKKAVAALGKDADPAKRRGMGKKLRRAQRKRRRLHVMDERRKAKASGEGDKKDE